MNEYDHSPLSILNSPLPFGCKQTDVGVIPEDWEVYRLGEGIRLSSGHHVLARHCNTDGDGVAYITGPADFPNGVIQHTKFTTRPGTICGAKDILVTVKGSGAGTIVLSNGAYCISRQLMAVRVQSWSTTYVYFSLLRDASLFGAAATGLIPGLSRSDILNKAIPLPPTKAEQEAIAEALSDADALIASLEQLLAKKRQLKQAAMQELLTGKNRLPGFSGEWTKATLGRMGHCYRGVSYNPAADLSPFDTESTLRLLRANNVQEAMVVFKDVQYVDSSRVSADQRLRPHDILICMANGSRELVGKAARFSADDGFAYTFGAFMGCFRSDHHAADPDFVFYLFQTAQYRAHIAVLLAGSSINNLTPGSVEAFLISVPSDKAEQTAIAAILSDMDGEIAALEAKVAKARNIKQGMMQELLTGRIRLIN